MSDKENGGSIEELAEWTERLESSDDEDPREMFTQVSRIALSISYDLIDKLRYWEKETLKLSDEEVEQRLAHMAGFLKRLKTAYVEFAEVDF